MAQEAILEQLRREITPDLYQQIREEWKTHSIAEDNRDIAGLMSTLTDDCVYELVQTGHQWHGKEGATRFYLELLGAFPDIHFDLQNIVIGPQGVCEEAHVTATHTGKWLDFPPTGEKVEFNVVIFFPWDMQKQKFKGERVYTDFLPAMNGR
jgi:predicted ester cyclase